jgi:hypothetical protein
MSGAELERFIAHARIASRSKDVDRQHSLRGFRRAPGVTSVLSDDWGARVQAAYNRDPFLDRMRLASRASTAVPHGLDGSLGPSQRPTTTATTGGAVLAPPPATPPPATPLRRPGASPRARAGDLVAAPPSTVAASVGSWWDTFAGRPDGVDADVDERAAPSEPPRPLTVLASIGWTPRRQLHLPDSLALHASPAVKRVLQGRRAKSARAGAVRGAGPSGGVAGGSGRAGGGGNDGDDDDNDDDDWDDEAAVREEKEVRRAERRQGGLAAGGATLAALRASRVDADVRGLGDLPRFLRRQLPLNLRLGVQAPVAMANVNALLHRCATARDRARAPAADGVPLGTVVPVEDAGR